MSVFHSVTQANLPTSGNVGDVYFVTNTGLLYAVVGDSSLVQLLISTPIPVAGPEGKIGLTGPQGVPFTSTIQYSGTWVPSPAVFEAGAVTSYNGFLYLALAPLNISVNTMPPAGNPYWQLLAPQASISGKQSAIISVIDGGGAVPTPGRKGYFQIPYNCVLASYSILVDVPGSVQYDIKHSSYANMPATVSICGSNPPALSNAQKNEMDISTLWSPVILNATDIIEVDLVFAATATQLTLQLFVVAL